MPVVIYSLLRLALFVVCLIGLVLAGTGWLLGVVGAALLAALLSYVLLRGPRDRAALWLQARSEARGDRPRLSRSASADAAEEDAAVEAAEREGRAVRPEEPTTDRTADRTADGGTPGRLV
ncbi:DUF4229 domain-containing protein [Cellulosimicrobium cellulans]|uniref:DUF4229 domain-containing protein n=1 Tax=Cellulosimicrobium cellulans TaxID=1710 RepID=UPI00130E5642|nr:DUF4229 domain-containing protein [Cellulosimicrobium cellulans]